MFTLLCAISIQNLKFFCKDRRLLFYMSRTLHLFGTDWSAMMVPIQVIRWYRMQCYDGTDSCATVVPIRRYCHLCKTERPIVFDRLYFLYTNFLQIVINSLHGAIRTICLHSSRLHLNMNCYEVDQPFLYTNQGSIFH